jgi:hypothetical protein
MEELVQFLHLRAPDHEGTREKAKALVLGVAAMEVVHPRPGVEAVVARREQLALEASDERP